MFDLISMLASVLPLKKTYSQLNDDILGKILAKVTQCKYALPFTERHSGGR